jgi:hypothetical protein
VWGVGLSVRISVNENAAAVSRPNGATGCSHGWSVGAATDRSPADAEPVGSGGIRGAAPVGAGEDFEVGWAGWGSEASKVDQIKTQ